MEIIILIITLFATIIGAISGIGGGTIIKPSMDALISIPITEISFLSGTTILAMTTVSLLRSINSSVKINKKIGILLGLGAVFGGIIGKFIFSTVKKSVTNEAYLGMIQNIVLVVLITTVFIYILKKDKIKPKKYSSTLFCSTCGFTMGMFSSFLGIGVGPVNIMILSYFFSMDSKNAAINSLFIIFFSQFANLVTNLIQNTVPSFSWSLLGPMMFVAVVGAIIGRKISSKITNKQIDKLFLGLMIIILSLAISNALRFGFGF